MHAGDLWKYIFIQIVIVAVKQNAGSLFLILKKSHYGFLLDL